MEYEIRQCSRTCAAYIATCSTVNAQTDSGIASGQVVLTNLSTPTYPPIARAAHITGEERVLVIVRPNGTIESVVVESGPALLVLRQEAIESAIVLCSERSRTEQNGAGAEIVERLLWE